MGLQVGGDLLPHGPGDGREVPAIEEARLPGKPDHVRVVLLEVHELGLGRTNEGQDEAVELGEGLVAVLGVRHPFRAVLRLEPVPLVVVAVEVSDEHVEQACLQEGARVHALLGMLVQPLPELDRVAELLGVALEAGGDRALDARVLLHEAEHSREFLAVLVEPRIVGQDHEPMGNGQDARGLREAVHDQRAGGLGGADLVLRELLHEAVAQFEGEHALGVLVDRAHPPFAAVRALELQRFRLLPAAPRDRLEPAGEAVQVQHLHFDGRRPEPPVGRAEEELVDRPGLVTGRRDDLRLRARGGGRRRRRLGECGARAEGDGDQKGASDGTRAHDSMIGARPAVCLVLANVWLVVPARAGLL